MVRTRIAPSPTGFPHIGTIYQALFDYAYAKKMGGSFVLRIEDTDRMRYVEGAEANIKKALDWFGINPDESPWSPGDFGPYRQSERLEIYQEYVQKLLDGGYAKFSYFKKSDSGKKDYSKNNEIHTEEIVPEPPKNVTQMLESGDWIVRMVVPQEGKIVIKDEIRGDIEFEASEVTEQVILKSDGFPTYHLASVIDDHLMKITHVVRGEEWLSSTPKHWLLYEYFGWDKPKFYHTPVLRNPDKSKLSKRHGHTNVDYYINAGFLPQTILNYLALLGWSHPEEKEVFGMEEFIDLIELENIKPVAPIFDIKKLEWMNGEYLRMMSVEELAQKIKDFDPEIASVMDAEMFLKFVACAQTRIKTLPEFRISVEPFFAKKNEESQLLNDISQRLGAIDNWETSDIADTLISYMKEKNIKFPVIYEAVIGTPRGLPLAEVFSIIGKEATHKLLK